MKFLFTLLFTSTLLTFSLGQNFTLGTIPDIQDVVASNSSNLQKEMQFYIDNKDSLNLQFVAFLGDYTAYGYDGYQSPDADWTRARDAFYMLRDAEIPYNPCIGNHDMDYVPCMDLPELALTRFKEYFPVSEYENKPGFGGYFRNMSNNYYYFSEAGLDFIVVTLQTHDNNAYYDTTSINWANKIIEENADKRAIFITHDFFEDRRLINDVVKKHDNLFLAICGHSCQREAYWTEVSPSGNTVHCMMADYQCDSDNGPTLRFLNFRPDENQICAYTWKASTGKYEKDANSQFCFDYMMRNPETPVVFNVVNAPLYPLSSDTTMIRTRIIDDLGIVEAKLTWGLESGMYSDTLDMDAAGEYFSVTLPEIEDKDSVFYRVYAKDTDGNDTITREYSYFIEDDRSKLPCPYNPTQGAFNDKVVSIPGRIQAENYNAGCNGFAYSDRDDNNQGGSYRSGGVDIQSCSDAGGGFNIGWTRIDEYLNYRVNVTETNDYYLSIRSASSVNGGAFHLEVDGEDITGKISLQKTGGWQKYKTTIIEGVHLKGGTYDIRLVADGDDFNLNYFDLSLTLETTNNIQDRNKNIKSSVVYPNTGNGLFTLQLNNHIVTQNTSISILDVSGRVIQSVAVSGSKSTLTIDLSDKVTGMYYIKAGDITHKVLKL